MFLWFVTSIFLAASYFLKDPIEVREKINRKIMAIEAETPEVYRIEDSEVEGVPIRIYFPNDRKSLPVALFMHGGGWLAGSIETHDNLARYLCREAQTVIVSVGYSNSPESKFPVALEQSYQVLCWISDKGLPIDVTKLSVVGDSAGGNMVAAISLMARDRKGPKIDTQVLINPFLDLTCRNTLEEQNDDYDIRRWFTLQYVASEDQIYNPYVSPVVAGDFSNLPKAMIILAENDELRGDGELFSFFLHDAGIPVIEYLQKGIGHLAGHGARAAASARESLDVAAQALR